MLKFTRGNFFLIKNTIKSNNFKSIIKDNILKQRIKKNFDIKEVSSLNNLRKNSVLFLDKDLKINFYNLDDIVFITENINFFNNKNIQNIILVKNLNESFNKIINFIVAWKILIWIIYSHPYFKINDS